ncbi:MAG TPA: 50S ribosomal protein L9 [Candidatus Binatia bacterium]|nr:50S ribosomal protein L9 [Candidatus Binatia bacterium]
MEVILREDVPDLGIIGDVVKVRPGYARNYLLPRGMAVPADRRSLAQLEHDKRLIEIKKQRERGTYERMAGSLKGLKVEIEARAGRGGKLFGSVTNQDVHKLLTDKGIEIDRRRIELRDPIKEIGEFPVSVRVGQDISATITVVVKALGGMLEGGEEESQAPQPTPPPPPAGEEG